MALYPQFCRNCSEPLLELSELVFCNKCLEKIKFYEPAFACSVCSAEICSEGLCGGCILDPPSYLFHKSYSIYDDELRQLVLLYKYGGVEVLKKQIMNYYRSLIIEINKVYKIDIMTTVPPDRGRKHRYDHNKLIARLISKSTGIPYSGNILKKTKSTPPQASLKLQQRLGNLNNAFCITGSKKSKLMGTTVLLVDDVFTTGTTMNTCSRVLANSGAVVIGVTLARSVV